MQRVSNPVLSSAKHGAISSVLVYAREGKQISGNGRLVRVQDPAQTPLIDQIVKSDVLTK